MSTATADKNKTIIDDIVYTKHYIAYYSLTLLHGHNLGNSRHFLFACCLFVGQTKLLDLKFLVVDDGPSRI